MSDQSSSKSAEGVRNLVKINDVSLFDLNSRNQLFEIQFLLYLSIEQLPLYPEKREKPSHELRADESTNQLEDNIRLARHTIADNLSFLVDAYQVSSGYYHHGIGKSKQLYESLTDEKEQTTKILAIASGGLLGLTLSLRKGIFKKLLYTSIFSGSVAAFCYPSKAKEYSDIACYITKNKIPPAVKEYTGVDLTEQFKNLNESLPDLSYFKNLWTEQRSPPTNTSPPNEKTK